MFDQVLNHAVELFTTKEVSESDDVLMPMNGSNAWVDAVDELVKTDGDAIAMAVDIISDPQLKALMGLWVCDGQEDFRSFVVSALWAQAHSFATLIAARVGRRTYDALEVHRDSRLTGS